MQINTKEDRIKSPAPFFFWPFCYTTVMQLTYAATLRTCFTASMVQAIINTFITLLFVTFQQDYGVSLEWIAALISTNFLLQLVVDLISARFLDKVGYRVASVVAHILAAVGLVELAVLPELIPAKAGIAIAVVTYALGGGLLEVIVSPMAEACPTENKERTMSFLHSFYCWGHMTMIIVSTIFFVVFGIQHWKILAVIWALVPLTNAFFLARVPMAPLLPPDTATATIRELFSKKIFYLMLVYMVCAGASELTVSQWSSALAEEGLGVSKTVGDLAGPLFFALLMGISRVLFSRLGDRMPLHRFMIFSAILCVLCYLVIALAPSAAVALIACGICGFSVGIFWPGTFSMASKTIRNGGTPMFALLALGGDLGCAVGPAVAGFVSGHAGGDLRRGILVGAIFPAIMLATLLFYRQRKKRQG